MGSIRELLVAACHPWRRGVHVGTDGTRLAHAQFLGEPAVRRGNRIAELARQRSLPSAHAREQGPCATPPCRWPSRAKRRRETECEVVEPSRQVGALEVRKRARLNPNFGYANDPPIAAAAD